MSGVLVLYIQRKKWLPDILILSGMAVFSLFILLLWEEQGYPPLRTMGETRLWYSLFLVAAGFFTLKRWKYRWLMGYSIVVSTVFIVINIFRPEIHSVNLVPALQSIWFIPHVTVYIMAYAFMGAATLASLAALFRPSGDPARHDKFIKLIDNLVYTGLAFLISGMLMGALWAKEAWGDYWSWDPKETWAFVTASFYILYIHCRIAGYKTKYVLLIIPVAFMLLMITWLGINCLPSAEGSIHTY
jgi:ABC-type transport system involved in cytochrome c biogenesis permease subunit